MFFRLLVAAVCVLASSFLLYLAKRATKLRQAIAKFKKESNGIPIVRECNIFTGHARLILHKRIWRIGCEFSKEYGDTFAGFFDSKPLVLCTDLDVIKRMIFDNEEVDRIDSLNLPVEELEKDSIMVARGDQWRRIRKAVAPAFSPSSLRAPNVQLEIRATINKFVDSIERKLEQAKASGQSDIVLNVDDHFLRFGVEQVFTSFYKQDNLINFDDEHDPWIEMANEHSRLLCSEMLKFFVTHPIFKPLVQPLSRFHPQSKFLQKMLEFIRRQADINLEAKRQLKLNNQPENQENVTLRDGSKFKRNMIDYVIDQYHERKLTKSEYTNSSLFIFGAAHKTSSDTLSHLVYHLAIEPEAQEKLRNSIRADGAESEYLMWCINETLRLFPPVLIGCSRTISTPLKTKVGYIIPKGSFVCTFARSIHRLTKYWGDDADEFRPERWANQKDFHPMQFIAFGAGKRMCPGKDIALHTIKSMMTILMSRYKFEFVPGDIDVNEYQTPFLIFAFSDGPINIKISRL